MRGTYPEPQVVLRFLDCLRPCLILARAEGSADLPISPGLFVPDLSINGDNLEAGYRGIVTISRCERQTAEKGMAGDEQIVRRWRPPHRPEANMEFACKLGHRGSERVHVDGGEEVMYASPSARIRRPLPELPRDECGHMDGPSTAFPL